MSDKHLAWSLMRPSQHLLTKQDNSRGLSFVTLQEDTLFSLSCVYLSTATCSCLPNKQTRPTYGLFIQSAGHPLNWGRPSSSRAANSQGMWTRASSRLFLLLASQGDTNDLPLVCTLCVIGCSDWGRAGVLAHRPRGRQLTRVEVR